MQKLQSVSKSSITDHNGQLLTNSATTSFTRLNNIIPQIDSTKHHFNSTGSNPNNISNNAFAYNSGSQNNVKLNAECFRSYNEYFPSSLKISSVTPNYIAQRFQSGTSRPVYFNYFSHQGGSAEETQFNSANSNKHKSINCFSAHSFINNEPAQENGNNPSSQFDKFLSNFKIESANTESMSTGESKDLKEAERNYNSQRAPLHSKLQIKLENNEFPENELPAIIKKIIDSKLKAQSKPESIILKDSTKKYNSHSNLSVPQGIMSKYEQEWLLYLQSANADEFSNL